jgi:hypothetical protein
LGKRSKRKKEEYKKKEREREEKCWFARKEENMLFVTRMTIS